MTKARVLLIATFLLPLTMCCYASDVYVAQSAAGQSDGTSCANAHAVSSLSGSDWSAGNTIHLCGIITSAITAQGGGTSSSPLTLVFEPGARISMPACPQNGCLDISNQSYVVVDGGTVCGYVNGAQVACNGVIESTRNGTSGAACTGGACNQQAGTNGVVASPCDNCEIRNLDVSNMYVHTSASDDASNCGCQSVVFSGTGVKVHNIVTHDNAWSIGWSGTNDEVYNVSAYNTDHCFVIWSGATNNSIHDNQCYNPYVWDTNSNAWHHDGIHLYTYDTAINNTQIYNNYFWGDWGGNVTAHIYAESDVTNTKVFNNLSIGCFNGDGHGGTCTNLGVQGNGHISFYGAGGSSGNAVYNNTIVEQGGGFSLFVQAQSSFTSENNIFSGSGPAFGSAGMVANSDYNVYYNTGSTLADIQAASGSDTHSVVGDPQLNTNFTLQSGSAAIGAGANLTSLNIAALDADRAGTARPSTGAWDAGAYSSGGSQVAPTAPSNLSYQVQ